MSALDKKTYPQLIKLLDREVSIFIRRKYAVGEYCICYTCGKVMHISEADAGHYISRRYYATRYCLDNIRPQCAGCNKFRGGEPIKFRTQLVSELGEDEVKRIEQLAEAGGEKHLPREWLIDKIIEFRRLNKS